MLSHFKVVLLIDSGRRKFEAIPKQIFRDGIKIFESRFSALTPQQNLCANPLKDDCAALSRNLGSKSINI